MSSSAIPQPGAAVAASQQQQQQQQQQHHQHQQQQQSSGSSGASDGNGPSAYECMLQGSIKDAALPALLQRLLGLCRANPAAPIAPLPSARMAELLPGLDVDSLASIQPNSSVRPLRIHEMGYMHPELKRMLLRVRHHLDADTWQICAFGQPEFADALKRSTIVRAGMLMEASSGAARTLLEATGFGMDHEMLRTGLLCSHLTAAGVRLDVSISRIQRLAQPGDVTSAQPLQANVLHDVPLHDSLLVEISALGISERIPEIEDEIHLMAEKLAPLVVLSKVDHRLIQEHMHAPISEHGRARAPQYSQGTPNPAVLVHPRV
ncbi:hypothetical protein CAOG_00189 [Capsaspora owczarzaki ATCC 30864]|nr:hypothetical protein CAOG_00189 [Capsaspora owczarzaki ATCC 30864]|eukprot:XP_004365060.1 hypothetical protein CAOG_00189 [Capsaspora owczarzaki ATCC 30864]